MPAKPITIVGGGLAGLTLGIVLRRKGVPVVLHEAGKYPRHKVCGEFISGRGLALLKELGLREKLEAAGAIEAKTVSFCSHSRTYRPMQLSEPALCLSRFQLDALLAAEFKKAGGELVENSRWSEPFSEGVVRATGRIAKPIVKGWRWFGLKIHGRNVELGSDLEMHFTPAGYVGVCRLPQNEVNICGVFRSATTVPNLHSNWRDWLFGSNDSMLRRKLANATFNENSFCSTAALCMSKPTFDQQAEVCLGDCVAMIPPVTGNGMSMAIESAAIAAEPMRRYSIGEMNWLSAQQAVWTQYKKQFERRLEFAALLQRALFLAPARNVLFFAAARQRMLWRYLFSHTR